MKLLHASVLILMAWLCFGQATAQRLENTFRPDWVKPLPTATFAAASLTDSSFVVSGWFYRNCKVDTFNLYLAPGCATDGYVARFNLHNKCLWAKRVGGPGTDRLRKIIPMPGGDFIIAGDFNSTSNYGGVTLTNYGLYDGVIARMDSNGNAKWVNKLGFGGGDDYANDISLSGDSLIVVGGSFFGGNFDSLFLSGNAADHAFVAGINPNTGKWLWARKTNGLNTDYVSNVTAMADTSIVVAGTFKGIFRIGNGGFQPQGAGTDIWVAKLDKNRKWAWAKQIGGSGDDYVTSVVGLPDGAVMVLAMGKRTVKFLPGSEVRSTLNDNYDIFITKYAKNGRLLWVRQFGGRTTADWASWMKLNRDGNLSVSGYFSDTIRLSATQVLVNENRSGFLARMDTGGNFFSVMSMASPDAGVNQYISSSVNTHAQVSDTHFMITGNFYSPSNSVKIGNMDYSSGYPDFVSVVKPLAFVTESQELMREITPFRVYPNPASDRVTVQSTLPMHDPIILTDALGKQVLQLSPAGRTEATLNTAALPAGMYRLKCGNMSRKVTLER